jgi:hypothetical protein
MYVHNMHIHTYIHIYTYMHTHTHTCISNVYIHVYMHVYIYIYTYIHIYIYICMYILLTQVCDGGSGDGGSCCCPYAVSLVLLQPICILSSDSDIRVSEELDMLSGREDRCARVCDVKRQHTSADSEGNTGSMTPV